MRTSGIGTPLVIALDELEEVNSKDFKYHDKVLSIWSVVNKRVKQLDAMRSLAAVPIFSQAFHEFWVVFIVIFDGFFPFFTLPISRYLMEDVNFIIGCFKVMLGTFLHLDGHIAVVLKVLCQPHGRKMAPPEFLDDNIAID